MKKKRYNFQTNELKNDAADAADFLNLTGKYGH